MTRIFEYPNKATPVGTDEIEIQETADGASYKTTLADAVHDVITAAGLITLPDGSVPFTGTVTFDPVGVYSATLGFGTGGMTLALLDSTVTNSINANTAGLIGQRTTGAGGMNVYGATDTAGGRALVLYGYNESSAPTPSVPFVSFLVSKGDDVGGEQDLGATETVFQISGAGGTTDYLTITGDGSVGIGDSTPTLGKLEVADTAAGTKPLLYLNQDGNNKVIVVDRDITNSNASTAAVDIITTSIVNDAGTYTKSGTTFSFLNNVTETSGTITDTSITMGIAQTHADATGNTVFIDSNGTAAIALNIDAENTSGPVVKLAMAPTADAAFLDFNATADADAVSGISTLANGAATTHHIQVMINGVKAWIKVSTNDPTA